MRKYPRRKATSLIAIGGAALAVVTGSAIADDVMKAAPSADLEATVAAPASKHEPLPVRPGFGYTIDFMTGQDAEALFPPGWAKQRTSTESAQD